MKPMFKSPEAKARMVRSFEAFRARMPEVESRIVPTRFGDTHVLVGGPEGAPPLVMLHGAMASSAHLLGELAPLLRDFRVYSVDVIGQSPMSADARPSVTNGDYGEWLRDVFDALALRRAHLVAVSWGAFAAQRFAALAPERIERLALLVPAGMVKSPFWDGLVRMGLPMAALLIAPSQKRREALLRNLLTTWDEAWVASLADAFDSYTLDMKVPARSKVGEFAGLKAPVFVVGADRDVSFPGAAVLARARELFPTLEDTELLADCNHSPPTTDAFRQWMSARLAAFLLGRPAPLARVG